QQARGESREGARAGVVHAVEQSGYAVPQQTLALAVDGMTCASCVGRVERALLKVPGVRSATVNLASERARIEAIATLEAATLAQAVEAAGYKAQVGARPETAAQANDRRLAHE